VIAVPTHAFVGMAKLTLDGIGGAFEVTAAQATDAAEVP